MKRICNPAIHINAYIPADKFIFRKENKSSTKVPREAYINWYKKLLWILEEIESKEFQQRIWIRGEGPESSSYLEVVCQYFNDIFLEEGIEEICKQKYLSIQEGKILKKFHDAFSKYNEMVKDPYSKEILETEEWKEIMNLAKKTLQKLKKNNRK